MAGEVWEAVGHANVNGIALLVAAGFAALVGVVCYAWGYWDGREAESREVRP